MKPRFTEDSFRKEPWFRSLCSALLSCKSEEEMASFLRDIATLSELQSWSERLEVAKELVKGLSYREVAKNTGASTTTVTRVAKFIENGEGGYRKYLKAHRHHRIINKGNTNAKMQESRSPDQSQKLESEGKIQKEETPKPPKPQSALQKYLQR